MDEGLLPPTGIGDFLIVATPTEHRASCEFRAYLCVGLENDTIPLYETTTEDREVPTSDHTKAQVFASGFLRFDACLNMTFDAQKRACCTSAGVTRRGQSVS